LNRPRRTPRRGTSLIEMVIIIGGATVLLSVCGGFMHLLLRLEETGRASIADTSNVSRLAVQFRRDVRGSTTAVAVPAAEGTPPGLDLTTPGRPVIGYRTSGDRLLRTETEGERVVRREGYRFTGLGPAAFEAGDDWVALVLPRGTDSGGMTVGRPGYRVEARLNKHRDRPTEGGDR